MLSDTLIREAEGFARQVTNGPFASVSFSIPEFLKAVRPFFDRKGGRDIISKAVLLEVKEGFLVLRCTDIASWMTAKISAVAKGFPSTIIVDLDSLFRAILKQDTPDQLAHLVLDNEEIYTYFFGGRIYIPTYKLGISSFYPKDMIPGRIWSFEAKNFKSAISSLRPILAVNTIPELSYLYFESTGVFASNGFIVSRYMGSFLDFVISSKNSVLLFSMINDEDTLEMTSVGGQVHASTGRASYRFPNVDLHFSDHYKALVRPLENYHKVSVSHLYDILQVLDSLPGCPERLEFIAAGKGLRGSVRSNKGEMASFLISEEPVGDPQVEAKGVSMSLLSTALKTFNKDDMLAFCVAKNGLFVATEKQQSVIILRR